MRERRTSLWLLTAVGGGVALGWAAAVPLSVISWGNLVIWGIANVWLGLAPGTKGDKVLRLGLYGFALGMSFMVFGYTGSQTLASRLVPFAIIGAFCGLCAVFVGALVHLAMSRIDRTNA